MDALSSRVRGASRAMFALKRPLQQAAPLTVKMIVALENVATLAPSDHWSIIAGHMLLCLGSCSRFGDSVDGPEGTVWIEAGPISSSMERDQPGLARETDDDR